MARKRDRSDLRGADVEVLQIVALQSRDPARVRGVLDPRNPVSASLLPHVIPLLGIQVLAGDAMQAVQRVADRHSGALVDALLDRSNPPAVRRRLARALSARRSQLVADGLLSALDDESLDVRVQSGRSLLRIRARCPEIRFDDRRMLDQVRSELGRETDLGHLFTLLSFVVPVQPLRAAYRGLRSRDPRDRGTALEYLHGVLPAEVRVALMGKLEREG